MYKCPVCGKECESISVLTQCVNVHEKKERIDKLKIAAEKAKKEREEKKNLILAAKKDINKQYEVLKDTIKKYNELVESYNKDSEEKLSTYNSTLTSHKSERLSDINSDPFTSIFDILNWR